MCGRYTLTSKTKVKEKFDKEINPNFNIAPQTEVLVINEKEPSFMNWCYNPAWAKKPMNLINARSETLREKPSFKNALRCIFVANGWYEWRRNKNIKIPYYHHNTKDELIYFAGIYNKSCGCAIVTREAHQNISFIHHRQPVLLEEHDFSKWMDGDGVFASISTNEIMCYQVSLKVNNPKNNDLDNLTALKII